MKITGRLQSLWPMACQDKTGSHSPVLCPPEIISPEVYPIGQPLFTNASLHRMLKHRIPPHKKRSDGCIEAAPPAYSVPRTAKASTGQEISCPVLAFVLLYYLCLRWVCQNHVVCPQQLCPAFSGPFARVFTRVLLSDARSHFWYISDGMPSLTSAICSCPPLFTLRLAMRLKSRGMLCLRIRPAPSWPQPPA